METALPPIDTTKSELLLFFILFSFGKSCFGSGITRREVAVFGSSKTIPPLVSWQERETVNKPYCRSISFHCRAINSPMRKPV